VKLSTKGRYAVMAMVDLARHSNGAPVCLSEIAERQEISLAYLEQLFAKLRRNGLVKSVRGPAALSADVHATIRASPTSSSRSTNRSMRCDVLPVAPPAAASTAADA